MLKTTGTICKMEDMAQGIYRMGFCSEELKNVDATPGQFVHISLPGESAHILPRPISIMDANPQEGYYELGIQIVGHGTGVLRQMQEGQEVTLLGPLGRGFDIGKAKRVYLVGGGMGVAPMHFAAKTYAEAGLECMAFFGFRNAEYAYGYNDLPCPVVAVTNDGSLGKQATVTQALEDAMEKQMPDIVLACGPTPMLRAIQRIAVHRKVACQLSLEEYMACGLGACLVCSCHVRQKSGDTYKRVCTDGPVFDAREVIFDAC